MAAEIWPLQYIGVAPYRGSGAFPRAWLWRGSEKMAHTGMQLRRTRRLWLNTIVGCEAISGWPAAVPFCIAD